MDGWSQLNQIVPRPTDGKYNFPSTVEVRNPVTRPSRRQRASLNGGRGLRWPGTNCKISASQSDDGTPMLPDGKGTLSRRVMGRPASRSSGRGTRNILMGEHLTIAAPSSRPAIRRASAMFSFSCPGTRPAINAYYNANNSAQIRPPNLRPPLPPSCVEPGARISRSTDQMWPWAGKEPRIVARTPWSLVPRSVRRAHSPAPPGPLATARKFPHRSEWEWRGWRAALFYCLHKNHIGRPLQPAA